MIEKIFDDNLIIALVVWVILYLGDYYLTIYGARLYRELGQATLTIQGSYELTPMFQKDINQLRLTSPRFMAMVALSTLLIILVWFFAKSLNVLEPYHLMLGGLMLREAVIHLRHWRNIASFRLMRQPNAVRGQLEYTKWFSYRLSVAELLTFAIFYLLLSLSFASWFFFGGAIACLVISGQHWNLARKITLLTP